MIQPSGFDLWPLGYWPFNLYKILPSSPISQRVIMIHATAVGIVCSDISLSSRVCMYAVLFSCRYIKERISSSVLRSSCAGSLAETRVSQHMFPPFSSQMFPAFPLLWHVFMQSIWTLSIFIDCFLMPFICSIETRHKNGADFAVINS